MKAARDFITVEDPGRGNAPAGFAGAGRVEGMHSADSLVSTDSLNSALALLRDASATAAGDAALMGFREAADFAGQVEELSRAAEYLQLVAAGAVDRARKQAAATAPKAGTSWTTGWRDTSYGVPATPDDTSGGTSEAVAVTSGTAWTTGWRDDTSHGIPAAPDDASGSASGAVAVTAGTAAAAGSAADSAAVVDDGYRNTTEFLRARLRISAPEARRRLSLAEALLPRQGFAGEPLPAVHEELGAAVASGEVASRSATIIALALDRVRHVCDLETAARMEHALTRTAAENDPDFLSRATRNWVDAIDQDGAEPSEELLRQLQGAFIRKPRHGLQHLEIFATDEQFEHLLTVMNPATNPRTSTPSPTGDPSNGTETETDSTTAWAATSAGETAEESAGESAAESVGESGGGNAVWADGATAGTDVPLDLRSRPQKLLDGLVGACKTALAAGTLPAAGGLRPQVMVTIDYQDLLARLGTLHGGVGDGVSGRDGASLDADTGTQTGSSFRRGATMEHTGTLLFTGPITASTVRKIACDADIIPVLLGGDGRILDIGRASRVFPPHIRKALTARDQGCAFPGCTIPAPWCEAHHISYWSRGGPTSTENGTLLCSHHHHLIHKEQWTIQLRTGIPWFIPPPHIDPRQKPRRNYYFHPTDLGTAA